MATTLTTSYQVIASGTCVSGGNISYQLQAKRSSATSTTVNARMVFFRTNTYNGTTGGTYSGNYVKISINGTEQTAWSGAFLVPATTSSSSTPTANNSKYTNEVSTSVTSIEEFTISATWYLRPTDYFGAQNSTTSGTVIQPTWTVTYNVQSGAARNPQTVVRGSSVTLRSASARSNSTTDYTVTYNKNGHGTAPSSGTCTKTTSYTWQNWNTKSDGTGTAYAASSSYTPTANITLYAYRTSSTSTSKVTMPTMTDTYYTHTKWNSKSDGTGTNYTLGSQYAFTANTTLYGIWSAKTATVTFNKASGSGGTDSVTATYGAAMPTITLPTRSYYDFGGYFTSTGGSGTKYYNANGSSAKNWDKTTNTTLYAYWIAHTCTATYNKNSGTGTNYTKTYTVGVTGQKLETAAQCGFVRTGYTLSGWKTSSTGASANWTLGNNVVDQWISNNKNGITLYAHWTPNTYTVTLNANGGSGGTGSVTATYDAAMPSITPPTRANWEFLGYFDAQSGGTKYYNANGSSARTWNKTAATTLWAHWNQLARNVTISINLDGTVLNDNSSVYYYMAHIIDSNTTTSMANPKNFAAPINTKVDVNKTTLYPGYYFSSMQVNSGNGTASYLDATQGCIDVELGPATNDQSVTIYLKSCYVQIYTSSGWKNAIPYIYMNNTWQWAQPFLYKNSSDGWKLSGKI